MVKPDNGTHKMTADNNRLDCCAAIAKAANATRRQVFVPKPSTRTSSGVNRSGINWLTRNGNQVPAANGATTNGNQRHRTAQTCRRTQTVSSACAATTGQVVTVICSGSMNSE